MNDMSTGQLLEAAATKKVVRMAVIGEGCLRADDCAAPSASPSVARSQQPARRYHYSCSYNRCVHTFRDIEQIIERAEEASEQKHRRSTATAPATSGAISMQTDYGRYNGVLNEV